MLTAAKYAKMGREVMSFTKELLLLQKHAVAQNDFPGTDHVAAQRGESGSEAERAVEFFPVLPRVLLLCNSKQYEF